MDTDAPFPFFDHFIPAHTVDFTAEEEVEARVDITSRFLQSYPVRDVGFEFVVFPRKLAPRDVDLQVERYRGARERLEREHGVKVHASLHFPTKNNLDLFLGASDAGTRKRVLALFAPCLDLAVATGIRTIVIHTGANIDLATWSRMKGGFGEKQRQLLVVADFFREALGACKDKRFTGKLAWENVPWPFDVPDTLTYTNLVARDFTSVFDALAGMDLPNAGQLGICVDLCHSWILERVARQFARRVPSTGKARVPPGVFDEEEADFLALVDMNSFVVPFLDKVAHVHLADSAGELALLDDGMSFKAQPSEGSELGTGEFSRSPDFAGILHRIAAVSRHGKLMCTLEVKDPDFGHPEMASRSLRFLGDTFFPASRR